MAPPATSVAWSAPVRASDRDRAGTIAVLRDHWLAGRLSLEEFEERCGEVWRARYVADLWAAVRELPAATPTLARLPRTSGGAGASVALAVSGLAVLLMSFGLLWLLSLPLTTAGWTLGRRARRAAPAGQHGLATAGEVLGAVGTLLACLAIAACAAIVRGW